MELQESKKGITPSCKDGEGASLERYAHRRQIINYNTRGYDVLRGGGMMS